MIALEDKRFHKGKRDVGSSSYNESLLLSIPGGRNSNARLSKPDDAVTVT